MQGGEVSCELQAASCKLQANSLGHTESIQTCRLRLVARCGFFSHKNKPPVCVSRQGVWNLILTMTYSHMGKPHTTIGDASFHY